MHLLPLFSVLPTSAKPLRSKPADIASYTSPKCSTVDSRSPHSQTYPYKVSLPEGQYKPFTPTTEWYGINWGTAPNLGSEVQLYKTELCEGNADLIWGAPGLAATQEEPLAGECLNSADKGWRSVQAVGYPLCRDREER